ncbi:hypothetical protein CRL40_08825 [Campylobacter coli]|nr:hypothetical protein [Campylobacter coli]EAI8941038.1 hypothetical protein [Campylobacter coli]EAI9225232.1 hypothetical protein [Campylobacter coli]EAI9289765.1 hypothetical protein [Campylobacter coli]EAJ1597746.1 hypothetical protein [Campylobacter coli]
MKLHDIVCNELRINRSELGNILGVSKTTIDAWSDPSRMSKTTEIALKQMLENHRLKEIFEAQANAYRKFLKYANENSSIEISDTHRTLIDKIRYVLKEYNLNSLTAAKKLKISFEELDRIMLLVKYPNFDFLSHFIESFFISEKWLLEDFGKPFSRNFIESKNMESFITEAKKYEQIYIIHCNDNSEYAKIIVKNNKDLFSIFDQDFCIGNFTMENQEQKGLFELYNFYNKNKRNTTCYIFDKEDYQNIISGDYFIKNCLKKGKISYLLEDLFDLNSNSNFYQNCKFYKECVDILNKFIN